MNCGGMRTIYRPGEGRSAQLVRLSDLALHRVIVVHVVVVPDRLQIVARKGVGVDHPAEGLGNEPPVYGVAFFLRRHSEWPEDRPSVPGLGPPLPGAASRNAPVHMTVPARDAERN